MQLQGLDASTYAQMARSSRMQVTSMPAVRGPILDRSGEPLAESIETYDLAVDQQLVAEEGNAAAYALQLEDVLDDDAAAIQRKLTGDRQYRVVARDVSPQTWREISAMELTGVYSEPSTDRVYPAGETAGNVIGFVGSDGGGLAGLEQSHQSQLAGDDGELAYQVASGGARIPLADVSRDEVVAGVGLQLTLDRDIQWHAEQILAEQVEASDAATGNAVVMDVRTGAIVAMATSPLVDPTRPGETATGDGGNPVVEHSYEPGSVFKPLSMAAIIEEGMAGPGTVFSVPDHIGRADRTIQDHYQHPELAMTLAGILAKSSNVGTILATERLSPDVYGQYIQDFGLGQSTDLGLPAETGGRVPSEWASLDRDFASFGQGISVTTLQMASAYATIANGGMRVPPRLVDATIDPDGTEQQVSATPPDRVISERTAEAVTSMMESVMSSEGTGSDVTVDGYRVAGKTGTAQRVDPDCGCYGDNVDVSFMGFAPADDPRYVVAVSLLDVAGGSSGSGLAGPVFADVMSFTLEQMGVAPSSTEPRELKLFAG